MYLIQGSIKWKPEKFEKIEILLCATVGTAKACIVYGRCGNTLKCDKGVLSLSALFRLGERWGEFSFDLPFTLN
jgi:hypothetical protein